LLPALKQAGTGLLLNIVRKRAPAAAEVIERVVEGLGLPVPAGASSSDAAEAIATEFERDPETVVRALQAVEDSDRDRWVAASQMIDTINETMRAEQTAQDWLQRNWRPIFALVTVAMIPVTLGLLYSLILRGIEDASLFSQVLMIVIPAMISVTGVYVWGRTKEKTLGSD
jgi:hypothetical protein